jgi:hypothetical protein
MPNRTVRRLSSNTTLRGATPTSPDVARNFMNYKFNHLTQRNTMPNVLGRGSDSGADWGPCNTSGTVAGGHIGGAFGAGNIVGQDPGEVKV